MNNSQNIPHGYKATALGIIPQEWEVKRIKDFGPVITGSTPSTLDSENYGGRYMFVSPADLSEDAKYIITTEKTLSDKGYSQARRIPKGSILFTCIGSTIGKIGIASQDLATNQQINSIVTNGEYLFYALSFQSNRIKILANEQAVPIINKSDFERIKVAFPPLAEQRKIAEVLGVWDEAIEKQARLIEKLALRKRALMQRLLSAKLRLPGFSEPWKKVKFCELFTKSIKTAEPLKKYEVLSVTKEGIVAQKSYFNKDIASEDTSKYIVVERGDLAMSGLNFWMGSCHILTNFDEGIISPAYKVFKVTEHNNIDFIRDFVRSSMFLQALQGCSVIGASIVRRNLDKEMLYEWTFKIPSLKEQTAIAEVLTAADREIELAKEKLERLRRQKRGLMQQLLTGKKRIKY